MPERFVDGGSIDGRRLGLTLVGTVIVAVVEVTIGVINTFQRLIGDSLTSLGAFYEAWVSSLLSVPLSVSQAAVGEVLRFTEPFGVFAFPIAVGIAVLSGWITYRSVEVTIGLIRGGLS